MKKLNVKWILAFAYVVITCNSVYAYEIKNGNYYYNKIACRQTTTIGGVTTYYYDVEATNKEGGVGGSFQQTYSGAINPPSTFSEISIDAQSESFVYTLTRIGDMAFANNASATELTIPATVTEIADMGLLVNMNLNKITCLAITPPAHENSFVLCIESVTSTATLYVPYGTKDLYANASGWRDFKNIVELSPSIGEHEYVDLGLPSGKLWSTMNYGAKTVTGYGEYVTWSKNDIISANWGSDWATPSKTDFQELVKSCDWTWDSQNGVRGYTVKGPNGNSMFLPAAGFQLMGYGQSVGKEIYYWSSTPSYENGFTHALNGNSSSINAANNTYNTALMTAPIRPIANVKTDKYTLTYMIDGVEYKKYEMKYGETIVAETEPTKEGYRFSGWSKIPATMPAQDLVIEGTFVKIEICTTPVIKYQEGKLIFSSDTEGVEFISNITCEDIKKHYEAEISLSKTYTISVYATKVGYEDSELATATLCWIECDHKSDVHGVEAIPATVVLIKASNGIITIEGLEANTPVTVCNISGTEVANGVSRENVTLSLETNLQKGYIAIVKMGTKSVKVVMK